ncbi:site-specific integrase [Streptomyces sp. NPDC051657]|uniref:tyrosine-type recombinase/integrase n=1 Tax=unclassified Streptomyces TaxID=2593676 RepID=UPI00343F7717
MTISTAQAPPAAIAGLSLVGAAEAALREKYPPRTVPDTWPATSEPPERIIQRLGEAPMRSPVKSTRQARQRGARYILEWLKSFPGDSWQQRWQASPAPSDSQKWVGVIGEWAAQHGLNPAPGAVRSGMLAMICADVLRPDVRWMAFRTSRFLREAMAEWRDPEGFSRLQAVAGPEIWPSQMGFHARTQVSLIMAAKGGRISDITVGDCLEVINAQDDVKAVSIDGTLFYLWLRALGTFPPDAPTTLRSVKQQTGQVSIGRLVDRYQLKCKPIRDLLVDYLTERQPALDYTSLEDLSRSLAARFWADLERHHPGINSLNLDPGVAAAWKTRLQNKTLRRRQPDGTVIDVTSPRVNVAPLLAPIRAFYLDIAQWAAEEPARWGPWVARCPITQAEAVFKKGDKQRKARMDQRTRERLPVLPALVRAADQRLKDARTCLAVVREAPAGSSFTVLGQTYVKATGVRWGDPDRTTVVYDETGKRHDLGMTENRAFWAWATIEFLRHTGVRIEEMLEASHHSIIQYKLPTTGEIVPLLQIAPSKTDEERVLLVTPELADVLSAIVSRVRDSGGAIPLVPSYDSTEKVWNPPMPLLFQWTVSGQARQVSPQTIRRSLTETLDSIGLTDAAGRPLHYQPHDFRRIFITDAILNGLPPHIAQVIAGHSNINTTMGYNTIYPAAVIEAHQAFIARRRGLRPGEEYRVPTAEEWESFLGHFERRKLSLGTCGRAFGTDCVHEHACVRCSNLRVDPHERPRLEEIRANLVDRIAEAEREGWFGEVDGLTVSLAAAEDKLAQLDAEQIRRTTVTDLGMPGFNQIAGRINVAGSGS